VLHSNTHAYHQKNSVTLPLYRLSLASSDLKVWILWAWLSHKLLGTGVCLRFGRLLPPGIWTVLEFLIMQQNWLEVTCR